MQVKERLGFSRRISALVLLTALLAATSPARCLGLAISTGAEVALGNLGGSVVRVLDPGGNGTGTILKIQSYGTGVDILVLTADHVVRDSSGGGSTLYAPNQINVAFGNQPPTGTLFAANAVATLFDFPLDGSNKVDLAMLDVFIPRESYLNLVANNQISSASLPGAAPAANSAIVQAGFGLRASVVTVGPDLVYSRSPVFGDGGPYGILKAGPNTVNAAGVTTITGALSDYPGGVDGNGDPLPTNFKYVFEGFQNGALINGNAGNGYLGSTSYIFSGDSGGPSFSGNTIVGVHSSSVTTKLSNDANSQIAISNNANYTWQDVAVFPYLTWINDQLTNLSPVPEPSTLVLAFVALVGLVVHAQRKRAK